MPLIPAQGDQPQDGEEINSVEAELAELRRLNADLTAVVAARDTFIAFAERCVGYTSFMRKPFRIAELIALTKQLIDTASDGNVLTNGAAPRVEPEA